jgi:acyl carrier protein
MSSNKVTTTDFSNTDIEEEVKKIIAEKAAKVSPSSVKGDARIAEDLGFDSLDAVEIIMALEERFAIEITDEEAKAVKTVQDAISLVKSAKNLDAKNNN